MNNSLPELLAPAGSIESFHAAIDAGADAVYLGLDDFNARLRAKNFTAKTLSYLVPYAHSKNVKVYVTFNTLVKQSELKRAISMLFQLEQIGIDALIVADPGIINIARNHFPELKLHGSTQMGFHNSAGAVAAARMGLKRIVLSRELTKDEIRTISKNSKIELEIFIHGALCYSISGMCLASSFLGGASGNRGRCTQVCRRMFKSSDNEEGYFVSPKDFCTIDHIQFFKENHISSLKIEGRMKGPEYVHSVVTAYRMVLDKPGSIDKAREILDSDMGRAKCSFFLDGIKAEKILDKNSSGTGIYIGKITYKGDCIIHVNGSIELHESDRIRIQPPTELKGTAVNVLSSEMANNKLVIHLKNSVECEIGYPVYLVSRKTALAPLKCHEQIKVAPVPFRESCKFTNKVLDQVRNNPNNTKKRDSLWVKIDNIQWIPFLDNSPCQHLIFAGDKESTGKLLADDCLMSKWQSRLSICLPPFIPESQVKGWRELIAFSQERVKKWVCANIGQISLFKGAKGLTSDNPVWVMNRSAQKELARLGINAFAYSTEDDFPNIRQTASGDGIAYLYSHSILFISRIPPDITKGNTLTDTGGHAFFTSIKNDLHYLISREALCLTHKKSRLSESGIHDFLIDLCFTEPDQDLFMKILAAYRNGIRIENTTLFNFKVGLK